MNKNVLLSALAVMAAALHADISHAMPLDPNTLTTPNRPPAPATTDPKAMKGLVQSLSANTALKTARTRMAPVHTMRGWSTIRPTTNFLTANGVTASIDQSRGIVRVEPDPKSSQKSLTKRRFNETGEDAARRFIGERKDIFNLKDASADLKLLRTENDPRGGEHVFFQQRLNGIPFWGRELAAHLDGTGAVDSINCLLTTRFTKFAPTAPAVSDADAIRRAEDSLAAAGVNVAPLPGLYATLFKYTGPTAELNYWQKEPGSAVELVWVIEVRPDIADWYRFFVSATSGEILEQYRAIQHADGPKTASAQNLLNQTKTINTYQIGSTYYLIDATRDMFKSGQSNTELIQDPKGVLLTLDIRNEQLDESTPLYHVTSGSNSWSDKTSVSAHDYGAVAYSYYRNTHSRDSLDGKGSSVISVIHVDNGLDNAFWNGAAMFYGDGGTSFQPLARANDVAVHEMTHGVIQNTANLEYKYQSGALNESFADVFGVIVDSNDYLIGEDCTKPGVFPTGALRSLQDPHNGGNDSGDRGWQPRHMNEFLNLPLSQDNGGVHGNSGIPNWAAYKVMNAIGRDKTGRLYYDALANRLLKQSNFVDCRAALEDSAKAIYGNNSTEHNAIKSAFAQVGIGDTGGSEPPEEAPVTPGTQKVITVYYGNKIPYVTNAPLLGSNTFTVLGANAANVNSAKPLSVDPFGAEMIYVDSTYALRSISTTGSNPTLISDDAPGWYSVAISPSGNKVALTRNVVENIIWILDLAGSTVTPLTLLHPTSGGTYDDIVLYADTVSWLDDDFLVYDALKQMQSPSGGTYQFWDINVADTASDVIYPLFPPQVEGVSMGNPTVSTRNSSLLSFVFVDTNTSTTGVYAVNLYSGQVGPLLNAAGYIPIIDYSVDDSKLIYSIYNNDATGYYSYDLPLSADGLSGTGAPQLLSAGDGYPNWFVVGTPTPQRDSLINFLLDRGGSPGIIDTNNDGRCDAADVEDLN
jgi:bacillolysin